MADITGDSLLITTIGVFLGQGDGPPETYAYACALDARSFTITRSANEQDVVETCGPGAKSSVWAEAGPLNWSISGSGRIELDTDAEYMAWMTAGGSKNIRIIRYTGPKSAPVAHSYIDSPAILTSYSMDQDNANNMPTASIEMQKGTGAMTYTVGAPA